MIRKYLSSHHSVQLNQSDDPILISAVTVAGHDLQVLLNITLIIMSYSSCCILISAVTVAGQELQVNICIPKYNSDYNEL